MSFFVDDLEPCDSYSIKNPKARRTHQCDACGCCISHGSTYHRIYMLTGGEHVTIKRCEACQVIYTHLCKMGNGDRVPLEALNCGKSYQEEWGQDVPAIIEALAFYLPGDPLPSEDAIAAVSVHRPFYSLHPCNNKG